MDSSRLNVGDILICELVSCDGEDLFADAWICFGRVRLEDGVVRNFSSADGYPRCEIGEKFEAKLDYPTHQDNGLPFVVGRKDQIPMLYLSRFRPVTPPPPTPVMSPPQAPNWPAKGWLSKLAAQVLPKARR